MENNNFDAKGQVIFIEPTWVTGETCLFDIPKSFEYLQAKSKLTNIRKEFILRLEKEGFVISFDRNNIANDTVCLIMDALAICGKEVDDTIYKKEFDKRMFEAGGKNLNYPYSLTVEEYFLNPFFPAVFKNETVNGGIDKFLIETREQLEIIKKFYKDFSSDKKVMEELNLSIFQQLIETPTKYKTYMRVLMSASGDVMGASLKYSKIGYQKREPKGTFEKYFWDENSEYFLNCNGMFNYYSGGENISFNQPRYSDEKREILKAHGIDSNNIAIPNDVLEVASNIAQKCNKELGIMCGIDFILNEKDNKWYYLEIQAFPAIEEWAVIKDIRVPKINTINDYVKYLTVELEARHDALMMYMNKKLSFENEEEKTYSLKLR